jgi:hypothetical protein
VVCRPRQTLALCAAALLALAGCKTPNQSTAEVHDPLMGEQKPVGVAVGPPLGPQNRAGMGAPAPPQVTTTKSNTAALLPADPLLGGRDLVIQDRTPEVQPTGSWQVKERAPGVLLKTPEPGPGSGPVQPVPPPTVPVPVFTPSGNSEPDPIQTALKSRGVLWQDQKTVPEGVRFSCAVPNPQDPAFSRVFEATGPDYRSAVLAVLDQIDKQKN